MTVEVLVALLGSSVLTAFVSGYFNRRKNRVDIADTINQMATRFSEQQAAEIERLDKKLIELEKENARLSEQLSKLRGCLDRYRDQVENCQEENSRLKAEIRGLGTRRSDERGLG